MSTAKQVGKQVLGQTETAARQVARNPWVERLMRLGYAVRGLLYVTLGLLAIEIARGVRVAQADQQGAMALIGAQPYGQLLLLVMAVGLAGYSVWGLVRAILNPLRASGPSRLGYLFSSLTYGALALGPVRLLAGLPQTGGQPAQVRTILASRWGVWLVGGLGLVVVAGGIAQVVYAWRHDFKKEFGAYDLRPEQVKWICRLGQFGTAARGIVTALIGFFLVRAALQFNPQDIKGVDQVLRELAASPNGPWLLAIVAAGLVAFGAYSIIGAQWFRLKR